jgi:hypothetical protein
MIGLICRTAALVLVALASLSYGQGVEPSDVVFDAVFVQLGKNLGGTISQRIRSHLSRSGVSVQDYVPGKSALTAASLVLSLGNAPIAETLISVEGVKSEGFELIATKYLSNSTLMACNGAPINATGFSYALDVKVVHYGAAVCAYAALEKLGYGFLHPLEPLAPAELRLRAAEAKALHMTEEPYWSKRTWHIHTQHPLEFTEVLNGFDAPMFTKDPIKCPDQSEYCESWDSMSTALPSLFEWLIANRQNRVEVLLLGTQKWDTYNDLSSGSVRQSRLRTINGLAHEFGLLIGADIPIAFMQQHAWAMVSVRDPVEKQEADIRARVDWAFQAEYDFISTESGLSEFTKPSCDLMLNLFNVFTEHITKVWKRETAVKVHCSSNEFCQEKDPQTGKYKYPDPRYAENKPINFNLLPTYADPGLGVMPHTVQVYSFDDPAANVYGNTNFSYMSDYMLYEASLKRRDVLYYAETAYWVNVDVDVPLFLPLSGQRRLYDLRRTARLEAQGGYKISGQMNFESGWEFGYYLSNAVAARAVWNPRLEVPGEWEAFRATLGPMLHAFGDLAAPLQQAIVSLAQAQADVMVYGKINGEPMDISDLKKLSGHAYMSGSDTWVDFPRLLGISFTQPDKVHADEPEDAQFGQAVAVISELKRVFKIAEAEFAAILAKAEASLGQVSSLRCSAFMFVSVTDSISIASFLFYRGK